MTKFSDFIRAPGTAGPPTREGIRALGFAFTTDIPAALTNYVWVGGVQSFSTGQKLQGRTNLGLGTIATQDASSVAITGGSIAGIADLAVADGGTGASNPATARTNLGLGNVDNTSDANKPVSIAQQTALDLKANLVSPALTGVPTAPTATAGTSTTQLATTAFVTAAIPAYVGPEFVTGLTISSNVTTPNTQMDVSAGEHRKGALSGLAPAMTKRIDQVWAAGNGGGWRDSVTAVAASATYAVYSIRNNTTGALDTLSSASFSAPTVPGGYTLVGRIGTVVTDGSANLIQRNQSGNKVVYKAPLSWFSNSASSATALVAATGVPVGVEVDALVSATFIATGAGADGTLDIWDALAGAVATPAGAPGVHVRARAALASEIDASNSNTLPVRTNSTGQVYRNANIVGTVSYTGTVSGFIDYQIPRLGA